MCIKIEMNLQKCLRRLLKTADIKLNSSLLKAILSALSEKMETADICVDSKGNPEPDPDLRDTENVPLKEDIHEYFEREVKPLMCLMPGSMRARLKSDMRYLSQGIL